MVKTKKYRSLTHFGLTRIIGWALAHTGTADFSIRKIES